MNLRKILAAALSLTMMCSAATTLSYAPMSAFAADPVAEEPAETTEGDTVTYPISAVDGGCKYSVYKDHAVLTDCDDDVKGDFVIPAEVNGVPVTKISERVFNFQEELVSVTFPATVTDIGGHLAGYSTVEKYIVDGNNKTFCSVDGVVFTKDKKKLVAYPVSYTTKTYTVPDGVETIGDGAAYTSDIESLILPDSVTEVEGFAYTYCKQLKSIKFSKNLKSIGYSGFGNCKSLESADIPASVEELGTNAFGSCTAMKTLTINNPNCKISDFKPNDDVVIRGYEGSTAQAYAEKNELTFEALSGEPPVAVTTTASAAATTAATTTKASQLVPTTDLKYGTANPIVKIIGGKPYDIKISGIFSAEGEKALDETADAAKITEIKSGIIVSLEMAVKSVDFTAEPASYAAASAMIKEKALSWYNDNYAASTGYKLTNLSINSIDIKEQAASTVTTATAAETTTPTAATTTTASVSTAVSTSSLKPKFIYAITFCDADTGSYIKGVQFTLKTNNDEDEDYGTVTAESTYTTLRGYGNKFTLTIVGVPEGYSMPKTTTFATETISDLVMTICISKDGTAYVKPRESSSTTASASAGSTTTTTTTATAAASTTASASGTMKVSTTATAASTTAPASTTAAATTVTEVVTTEMSEKDFVGTWRATGLLDSVGEREEAPFDAPFILSLNEDGTCVLSYDSDERHDTIELNWEYKDKTFNLLNDAGKPLPLKYENDELVLELNGNTLFLSKEDSYLGYVNDDDKIDAKDASVVLVAYAKASTGASYGLTEKKCAAADVNHDGKVDAKDASAILSYYSYISTGGKESIAAFLKASN